jgi:hypothetical protein
VGGATVVTVAATGVVIAAIAAIVGVAVVGVAAAVALGPCQPWSVLSGKTATSLVTKPRCGRAIPSRVRIRYSPHPPRNCDG